MQMFVYPVLQGVELPADFVQFSQSPENPATLYPAIIAEKRMAGSSLVGPDA